MTRYYCTRVGLRFYAVKDDPNSIRRLAITSLKQHGVGRLIRIQLAADTITEELQPVTLKELPTPWREAFDRYFWRLR